MTVTLYNPQFSEAPPYVPGYSPGMALAPGLDSRLSGISMNPAGLAAYRQQALRTGPSSWALLARQDQNLKQQSAREQGAKEVAGQTAQTEDALAAKGGLSSGAKERAATEGGKNYLAMSQELARTGNQNDLQIGMNDESNRITQLGQLPGMEAAALQPELQKAAAWEDARKTDLAANLTETDRRNQYNQTLYGQKMAAWAANQQANATMHSGKKG